MQTGSIKYYSKKRCLNNKAIHHARAWATQITRIKKKNIRKWGDTLKGHLEYDENHEWREKERENEKKKPWKIAGNYAQNYISTENTFIIPWLNCNSLCYVLSPKATAPAKNRNNEKKNIGKWFLDERQSETEIETIQKDLLAFVVLPFLLLYIFFILRLCNGYGIKCPYGFFMNDRALKFYCRLTRTPPAHHPFFIVVHTEPWASRI